MQIGTNLEQEENVLESRGYLCSVTSNEEFLICRMNEWHQSFLSEAPLLLQSDRQRLLTSIDFRGFNQCFS